MPSITEPYTRLQAMLESNDDIMRLENINELVSLLTALRNVGDVFEGHPDFLSVEERDQLNIFVATTGAESIYRCADSYFELTQLRSLLGRDRWQEFDSYRQAWARNLSHALNFAVGAQQRARDKNFLGVELKLSDCFGHVNAAADVAQKGVQRIQAAISGCLATQSFLSFAAGLAASPVLFAAAVATGHQLRQSEFWLRLFPICVASSTVSGAGLFLLRQYFVQRKILKFRSDLGK